MLITWYVLHADDLDFRANALEIMPRASNIMPVDWFSRWEARAFVPKASSFVSAWQGI
jgi:hypothetical protein